MFYTREAMRIAYLFAIYNDGRVNKIYEKIRTDLSTV